MVESRPECIGIGFILGHKYPVHWSFEERCWKVVPFCTRCGLAAEYEPAQRDGPVT